MIGDDNVIREGVTIHRGMLQDRSATTIGNHNLFMAYVHVGHDCEVGDHVIMANNASLAGHVSVGDHANIGGYSGILQFRTVGAYTHIAAFSYVIKDVPAYVTAGRQSRPRGRAECRGHAATRRAGGDPDRPARRVPHGLPGGSDRVRGVRGTCGRRRGVGGRTPVRRYRPGIGARHRASPERSRGGGLRLLPPGPGAAQIDGSGSAGHRASDRSGPGAKSVPARRWPIRPGLPSGSDASCRRLFAPVWARYALYRLNLGVAGAQQRPQHAVAGGPPPGSPAPPPASGEASHHVVVDVAG